VHTILKDWFVAPFMSYQKDGNSALTSVGRMWSVLKCAEVWLCSCHDLSLYSRWAPIILNDSHKGWHNYDETTFIHHFIFILNTEFYCFYSLWQRDLVTFEVMKVADPSSTFFSLCNQEDKLPWQTYNNVTHRDIFCASFEDLVTLIWYHYFLLNLRILSDCLVSRVT
jgi:hypothetical protein